MDTTVLRTFVSILDEGSFAAAARRMGISRSLCSKNISDLELDLGARLLTRTTRSVRPTALGLEYSQRIREVLAQLDAANEMVRKATEQPAGLLRIGAPEAYTHKVLLPYILRFMDENPDIKLDLALDDQRTNLTEKGFDAVIRIGYLEDSTLHARKLHEATIFVVASPDYLEKNGYPEEPADLAHHDCLHYTNIRGAGTWPLRDGEKMIHQKINPIFSSNNTELLHAMAVNGRGVALLPEFTISDDIVAGKLVPLMRNYALPNIPVSLIYPSGKLMTAAMRSFLDFATRLSIP